MRTFYLLSCVSRKQAKPTFARDLYTSAWFTKARRYVETIDAFWYILSAEHGLLNPHKVINPYEKMLNHMDIANRRVWSAQVLTSLLEITVPGDQIVFLAGAKYREFLEAALTKAGIIVNVPMRGLGIGRQLHWLQEAIDGK